MQEKDIAQYTPDEKRKIDRAARRDVPAECRLILSAGFAFLMVFTFFFAKLTFLPIATALDVRPFFVWIALSAGAASVWAALHYWAFARRIARAKTLSAAFLHEHERQEYARQMAKLKSLETPD